MTEIFVAKLMNVAKKIFTVVADLLGGWNILSVFVFTLLSPSFWIWKLIGAGRFGELSLVSALWLISVAVIFRELRHKRVTTISLGVFLVWMVSMGYVFHEYLSNSVLF